MSDQRNLGDWQFIGRRGGDVVTLVDGSVIAAVPEAKQAAEEGGHELKFDFLDDGAVLTLLRKRHVDEEDMFKAGFAHGVPLAFVSFGAVLYWGGVARYWETPAARTVCLAVIAAVVGSQLFFFVRSAISYWGDPVRQNIRARARRYREIVDIARLGGADIPACYPHYGPYLFAARFHPEVDNGNHSESGGLNGL